MMPTLPATVTWCDWVLPVAVGVVGDDGRSRGRITEEFASHLGSRASHFHLPTKTRVPSTSLFWIGTIAAKRLSYVFYTGSVKLYSWCLDVLPHLGLHPLIDGNQTCCACEAPDGSPRRSQEATWL